MSLTGQIGQIFIVTKNTGSRMSRLHCRIAGVSSSILQMIFCNKKSFASFLKNYFLLPNP
ncbi:MAG: hypothetical protein LBP59_15750 [Planctomycetaceae bacterium]|nr:hypothetical protein [Planctomycetaceae bacterium]